MSEFFTSAVETAAIFYGRQYTGEALVYPLRLRPTCSLVPAILEKMLERREPSAVHVFRSALALSVGKLFIVQCFNQEKLRRVYSVGEVAAKR